MRCITSPEALGAQPEPQQRDRHKHGAQDLQLDGAGRGRFLGSHGRDGVAASWVGALLAEDRPGPAVVRATQLATQWATQLSTVQNLGGFDAWGDAAAATSLVQPVSGWPGPGGAVGIQPPLRQQHQGAGPAAGRGASCGGPGWAAALASGDLVGAQGGGPPMAGGGDRSDRWPGGGGLAQWGGGAAPRGDGPLPWVAAG